MRKFFLVVVLLAAAIAVGYWWLQDQFYAPGPSTDIVRSRWSRVRAFARC